MRIKKVILILLCINLFACTEEDDDDMVVCDYENFYPDIPEVGFTVNGTSYLQNVGATTFRNEQNPPDLAMIYSINGSSNGKTNIDLRFTHAKFLNNEDCDAAYEHRIFFNINLDQGINERKSYPVTLNSSVPGAVSASYVFEKNLYEYE